MRGWAVTSQELSEEGMRHMRHGLTAFRTIGTEVFAPYFLLLQAEGYARLDLVEAGLIVLQEGWR